MGEVFCDLPAQVLSGSWRAPSASKIRISADSYYCFCATAALRALTFSRHSAACSGFPQS